MIEVAPSVNAAVGRVDVIHVEVDLGDDGEIVVRTLVKHQYRVADHKAGVLRFPSSYRFSLMMCAPKAFFRKSMSRSASSTVK